MRTLSAEVFPAEPDRWIAAVDDDDSTEASSPDKVLDEVRSTIRAVRGWEGFTVELHGDVGRPWRPSDAPVRASRMGVDR